jgi:hypothetical protein
MKLYEVIQLIESGQSCYVIQGEGVFECKPNLMAFNKEWYARVSRNYPYINEERFLGDLYKTELEAKEGLSRYFVEKANSVLSK